MTHTKQLIRVPSRPKSCKRLYPCTRSNSCRDFPPRRGYHVGGTDPKEKEHITASFKNSRSKDIGDAVHIYRHDDAKDTD